MLIYEVKKLSELSYVRTRNPSKVYLIDTGLAKNTTSLDLGRLLNNVVFIELKRRNYEIFYFDEKNECDFIAKKDDKFKIFQVTWELNENNQEKEISGILTAAKYLYIQEGIIITYDYEGKINQDGIVIDILPAWKWLLKSDIND